MYSTGTCDMASSPDNVHLGFVIRQLLANDSLDASRKYFSSSLHFETGYFNLIFDVP